MPVTESEKRCSQIATCRPFLMFGLRGSHGAWASYCEGRFTECARYRLSASRRPVPENLLPNGRELDVGLI